MKYFAVISLKSEYHTMGHVWSVRIVHTIWFMVCKIYLFVNIIMLLWQVVHEYSAGLVEIDATDTTKHDKINFDVLLIICTVWPQFLNYPKHFLII